MKRFNKLLIVLFLFPLFTLAQSNYKPGFIINSKGDTLHGFINYTEWENNPKSISFKHEPTGTPLKFTVNDLKYFSVSVGHLAEYQRYTGPITTNDIEINHLPEGRDTSFVVDTVFLKVLQKGDKLLLFSYTDHFKICYFISENPSDQPKELIYRIYYKNIEGNDQNRTAYESSYKGQLYDAAAKAGVKSAALKNDIQKADYKESDLLSIAAKINGVSETDFAKTNASKPKTLKILIVIAAVTILAIFVIHDFVTVHN
jgi:hypothetical protein